MSTRLVTDPSGRSGWRRATPNNSVTLGCFRLCQRASSGLRRCVSHKSTSFLVKNVLCLTYLLYFFFLVGGPRKNLDDDLYIMSKFKSMSRSLGVRSLTFKPSSCPILVSTTLYVAPNTSQTGPQSMENRFGESLCIDSVIS